MNGMCKIRLFKEPFFERRPLQKLKTYSDIHCILQSLPPDLHTMHFKYAVSALLSFWARIGY